MAKTTTTQKEPVRLREKKLSNGNVSLYLDICRNGRRHKEYLKLYLIDAKTPLEREQNRQTLATAQAVKSKRLIEIQNGEYTFTRQFKENTPFLEYYRKMVEERRKNPESQGNWGNWIRTSVSDPAVNATHSKGCRRTPRYPTSTSCVLASIRHTTTKSYR